MTDWLAGLTDGRTVETAVTTGQTGTQPLASQSVARDREAGGPASVLCVWCPSMSSACAVRANISLAAVTHYYFTITDWLHLHALKHTLHFRHV